MNAVPVETLTRWASQQEGQFFERKSAFDRGGGTWRHRKATDVARDVAATLSAMANADGGEMVIGIEDNGDVSGVPHPADKRELIRSAPTSQDYVKPPLRARGEEMMTSDGKVLLHFQVDWSPEVHQLTDGRYLLRVSDANQPFDATQIAALKQTKGQGLWERSFPPGATLDDVDLALVRSLSERLLPGASAEDTLRAYRLVENRNGRLAPNLAGLLLFGKDPLRWHPRCGIDFVRWEGVERRHGAELNIAKRIPVEFPLAVLPEKAYAAIQPFIRERHTLQDLFFTERLEYPTFAWQEAIVNAIAHRDYSIQGLGIEVSMFDDRLEIRSPGLPPSPITLEDLKLRRGVHLSRNPLAVRVLVALGYMRELGEGIPRMFDVMEREGFYPPQFDLVSTFVVQVTLLNQPVYDPQTLIWLQRFENRNLTGDQKRILAYAKAHGGHFTSREFQKLVGLDIYRASSAIKDLIGKQIARLTRKGGRVYEIIEPSLEERAMPGDLALLLPLLQQQGFIVNQDVSVVLQVSTKTATRILQRLTEEGWLDRQGKRRWARYILHSSSL